MSTKRRRSRVQRKIKIGSPVANSLEHSPWMKKYGSGAFVSSKTPNRRYNPAVEVLPE